MSTPFQWRILVRKPNEKWVSDEVKLSHLYLQGDSNAINRVNQAKPMKGEPNDKLLQAQLRRQRRIEGLQLFEKTKINR